MSHIYVIGMGPGDVELMTCKALNVIKKSDVILGAPRLIEMIKVVEPAKIPCQLSEMEKLIEAHHTKDVIGILASGDIGFYSIAKWVQKRFGGTHQVECINGISSMQYFCNKLCISYEEVKNISVHGRENKVLQKIMNHPQVFVLTGGTYKVQHICQMLCAYGLDEVNVYVGENLSYPDERILSGVAKDFSALYFDDLAVMLIEKKPSIAWGYTTHGIPDEAFIRGKVPMTKEEVRSICLSKLRLKETDILYDIGAGTGSVAIEMAKQAKKGFVYALEKNEEGIQLIYANQKKFETFNMQVIQAECPEGIEELPAPDKVFIGGSSGQLKNILELVLEKNHLVRIVVTAITLETLSEALECAKAYDLEVECTQISAANSKKVGSYHMMMGQNPIFILTMEGKTL